MDRIDLLQERKAKIAEKGKDVRAQIEALCDEKSFVETSAFSFSKNDFYGEDENGEGVITGFATVGGYPYYIVAQNGNVCSGGISKANCDKIARLLDMAEKNSTPVIYLLNSLGVQFGEGVPVLEGLGKILMRATQLKGVVLQFAILSGEVFGSVAMLAAIADFTFYLEGKSVLSLNSPFVLSAKEGKSLKSEEVGGAKAMAKSGTVSFTAKNIGEVKDKIYAITELFSLDEDKNAELNESFPELNDGATAEKLLKIFDGAIEVNMANEDDVKTLFARVGGIAVSAIVFDGKKDGVLMTANKFAKIKEFTELSACYGLPLVIFSDVKGIVPSMTENSGRVMKEAAEYLNMLDTIDTPKIAVVYKRAVGLGYSLFAAKEAGFDYTCAFADAQISVFDNAQGAKIEFGAKKSLDKKAEERYADEKGDPINAAKDGYIDAIIEPQFVKQYLISALQMLER